MVLLPSSFQGNRTKALYFLSISKTVTENKSDLFCTLPAGDASGCSPMSRIAFRNA